MDNLSNVIAENLKRIREEKKLSLDAVAKLSGVSKSMLGQIEHSDVNPTVSTLWKIANGLKISFSEFINHAESNVELIDTNNIEPLIEGKVKIYPTFPFDSTRRFEIYYLEFDRNGYFSTEPHLQGTQEFITVFVGELTVVIGDKKFVVKSGKAIRFKADIPHSYENTGDSTCSLDMIIYYPE